MRLTLRTLLAYLDDILEPADARELGQKIEESEFASGLVHRIRSVTRKLRLGAPKLAGKGMGLDANTVAEYLDNTLPQDRVPDFEKVCLESDVHLAEVASCHQILTLVLGEPADVDPALRERIRTLQARDEGPGSEPLDEHHERRPVEDPTPPPMDRPPEDWDEKPDMPLITPATSYPTTGGSPIRLLPVVATLVVAFLLALVALIAMGPLDSHHPILGRFLADASPTKPASPHPDQDMPRDAGPNSRDDQAAVTPALDGHASEPATTVNGQDASMTAVEPALPAQPAAGSGAKRGDSGKADVPAGTFPLPPGTANTEPPAPLATGDTAGAPAADSRITAPGETTSMPAISPSGTKPPGTGPASEVAEGTAAKPGEPAEPAKEPEPLARSTSDLHVLARFDPAAETWLRLAPNSPIASGQQLIALPTYRPQIALSNGIQLTLVGPAAVSLLDPDTGGIPGVVVQYGRILAVGDGKPGTALNVHIGDRISRVVFQDLDSVLALEVLRYQPPGANPEEVTAHRLIGAMSAAGRLAWEEEGAAGSQMLEAGQMAAMIDIGPPQVTTASPPEWLDARNLRPIDRDASKQLQLLLDQDRPLTTSLSEQVSNRLVEVRALAIRSLSLLDIYDPFVTAFNSKELRTFWPDLFDTLQAAVAHDPETAAQVRSIFERLRGDMGRKLYRLLWGYSPEQLSGGEGLSAGGPAEQRLDGRSGSGVRESQSHRRQDKLVSSRPRSSAAETSRSELGAGRETRWHNLQKPSCRAI